jgi:hypothetical protein
MEERRYTINYNKVGRSGKAVSLACLRISLLQASETCSLAWPGRFGGWDISNLISIRYQLSCRVSLSVRVFLSFVFD